MRISSFAFGILVLVIFIYYVGVDSIERILLSVSPIVIISVVALQFLSLIFYASAWYVLIRSAGYRMPYLTCQGITLASIFAVYTMPSGVFLESARCILASKETGMKIGESTATVILHRMLYIVGFLTSTAFAFVALLIVGKMGSFDLVELSFIPIISIAGLIVLFYLSLNPRKIEPIIDRCLRSAKPIIQLIQKDAVVEGKAGRFFTEYHSGFRRVLGAKAHMLLSFASSMGDWACSVLILWFILASMGANASIWVVVITMAVGKMIQMTPVAIPGMVGVYEAAITTTLAVFAVPIPIAASAALLSRVVTVWLELPVTGVAAYHYGFKLLSHGAGNLSTN